MRIGIDVGGTHTDAVVLEMISNSAGQPSSLNGALSQATTQAKGSYILATAKTPTDHGDLVKTVVQALTKILEHCPVEKVSHLTLSTTLTTNMVAENRLEPVLTAVVAGPGLNPEESFLSNLKDFPGELVQLTGAMDHRGREVLAPSELELENLAALCKKKKFKVAAVIGKFSQRNPNQEGAIAKVLSGAGNCDYVAMGHRMSSRMGFPRRVGTTIISAAVWNGFVDFADAVRAAVSALGLKCSINILKADCGTLPLDEACDQPAETILAGPAASVMGLSAICRLDNIKEDCIIIDIGGSTTDIAFITHGSPVLAQHGVNIGSWKTLVRGLDILVLPIGGDSPVLIDDGQPTLADRRLGPCAAAGGTASTLMDCLNLFKVETYGDVNKSYTSLEDIAMYAGLKADELADDITEYAAKRMAQAIKIKLESINNEPVLTLHELFHGMQIKPTKIFLIGGPAKSFAPFLEKQTGIKVVVPAHYQVANAIGAALTRTTMDLELFADTEQAKLSIPALGVNRTIDKSYDIEEAKTEALQTLTQRYDQLTKEARQAREAQEAKLASQNQVQGSARVSDNEKVTLKGNKAEIVEAQSFNMIDGYSLVGRNIRVHCQIKPSLDRRYLPLISLRKERAK